MMNLKKIKEISTSYECNNAYQNEFQLSWAIDELLKEEHFKCEDVAIFNGRDEYGLNITLVDDNGNRITYKMYEWALVGTYDISVHWEDWSNFEQETFEGIIIGDDEDDIRNIKTLKIANEYLPYITALIFGIFWGETHIEKGYNKSIEYSSR